MRKIIFIFKWDILSITGSRAELGTAQMHLCTLKDKRKQARYGNAWYWSKQQISTGQRRADIVIKHAET